MAQGIYGAVQNARLTGVLNDSLPATNFPDWRVKLSLAPGADYLYKAPNNPGILAPLAATDGVIFPYTPQISVAYTAMYDTTMPAHSNYKIYQYTSSAVDQVTITGDFTAQDTYEANYVLAVIHFFRSVTKMFYGQDEYPKPGTPPPLVFIDGMGAFQFNRHPLIITNFTFNLPNDVDYIRSNLTTTAAPINPTAGQGPDIRLGSSITRGGQVPALITNNDTNFTLSPTYVPTKMQIQVTALPIVSRNQISNAFSLRQYATGALTKGNSRAGGGIW